MKLDTKTIVSIILAAIGIILIIGTYKEKVDDNEKAVEVHAEKIDTLEEFSIEQTMLIKDVQTRNKEQIEMIQEIRKEK